MRVLALFFHFPPMSGGGPVVSFDIANTIAAVGHQVTVLVPDVDWKGKKYEPHMHKNLSVIRVETPSKTNLKVAARRCAGNLQRTAEKICGKNQFDVIFTIFHPFHLVPNAAVSCAKKTGIPAVIKVDDAVYEKSSGLKAIQRRIEKRFSAKSLQGASKIFVLNEQLKKVVSEHYSIPLEKISVMPNGIDLSFFDTRQTKRERKIVFSGVMYYHRGLEMLLEATTEIIKEFPDVKVVLLGEGPELQRLQDIVLEKKLTENVEFKGWVQRTEIPAYLSNAIIGIGPLQLTPLTAKSIPVKVLEYMASSLPIIAKKGSLSDDVLRDGENGYFIEDAYELAEKTINFLQNPSLVEKMGNMSRNMVQKFSWQNLLFPVLEKYDKAKSTF
jgi:glycosyltransferase involved in cell wall biosynthesis